MTTQLRQDLDRLFQEAGEEDLEDRPNDFRGLLLDKADHFRVHLAMVEQGAQLAQHTDGRYIYTYGDDYDDGTDLDIDEL